ncbi:GntR family transcriptional regulator [Streptomyces sp. URMC 123]|uniref:GntR family transcriptional regulator n=1 Tax=Streptomyces sp. URMC 123 TaxID=3423403 RepID=UPI003F1D49C1
MALKTDDPRPPYVQVADTLRSEIRAGKIAPGQKLPSVRQLSERFGVAKMTVDNALKVLRGEALVSTMPTRGTFVRNLPEGEGQPPSGQSENAEVLQRIDHLASQVERLTERVAQLESRLQGAVPACSTIGKDGAHHE